MKLDPIEKRTILFHRDDRKSIVRVLHPVKSAFACFLFLCLGLFPLHARAQDEPSRVGIFATVGGGNTQFPLYSDNSLGFRFGAFYQHSALLGAEVRAGVYPVAARYTQAPITAGYRIGLRSSEGESHSSIWRASAWSPYAYIGGGFSYAQDSGTLYLHPPTESQAAPAWEFSAGLDHAFRHFSWRIAEVSYVKTYTSLHDLRTPYLSTGIVYHLK
ncbi:hypothetical protein [Silvibacterium sp.]|uniref:hypothetical protein n=1 Tax=Silvibacterium sp. TaxID=1964179 RepID=UPI0039E36E30